MFQQQGMMQQHNRVEHLKKEIETVLNCINVDYIKLLSINCNLIDTSLNVIMFWQYLLAMNNNSEPMCEDMAIFGGNSFL